MVSLRRAVDHERVEGASVPASVTFAANRYPTPCRWLATVTVSSPRCR